MAIWLLARAHLFPIRRVISTNTESEDECTGISMYAQILVQVGALQ